MHLYKQYTCCFKQALFPFTTDYARLKQPPNKTSNKDFHQTLRLPKIDNLRNF
jgi:hypothetical protein